MLFMVIERFRDGNPKRVGERFQESGRMLPAGVTYHTSWIDLAGACCYQVMETANPELLEPWLNFWGDLIEFEIVPVQTSADFWASAQRD